MSNNIRDMYVFITNKNEDMQCIGIKIGKFHGVVYKYGNHGVFNWDFLMTDHMADWLVDQLNDSSDSNK